MFRRGSRRTVDNVTRLKTLIRSDRAAIRLQETLETKKKEDEVNDIWDYSLFRRVVGDKKKKLHNWFWEKW